MPSLASFCPRGTGHPCGNYKDLAWEFGVLGQKNRPYKPIYEPHMTQPLATYDHLYDPFSFVSWLAMAWVMGWVGFSSIGPWPVARRSGP